MLVAVDMVQREAGRTEPLELRLDFRFYLLLDLGREEKFDPNSDRIVRKSPVRFDQRRDLPRRKNWTAVDQGEVQANTKRGQTACPLHCIRHRRRAHHQARSRENAVPMTFLDGFVDRHRRAKIIRRDNESLQMQSLLLCSPMQSRPLLANLTAPSAGPAPVSL